MYSDAARPKRLGLIVDRLLTPGVICAVLGLFGTTSPRAAASSPPDQVQSVHFDAGVSTTGGLSWTFSRHTSARDAAGVVAPPNVERFAPPTLLAGAPANVRELTDPIQIRTYAAGYDVDGAPILVVNHGAASAIDIHIGQEADVRAYVDGDWSQSHRFPYADPDRDFEDNLLLGQTGLDGGTPSIEGYAFTPKGAQVYNGLIVVQCDVLHDSDGNGVDYAHWKTAMLWTTVDRLETAADPWIIAGVSARYTFGSFEAGQTWSINGFPLAQDDFVATVCSYQTSSRLGGHAYLVRFVRDEDWSVVTTVMLDEHEAQGEHYHCAGIIRHPDGRLSVLISIGDGVENNRLLARTLDAGGVWSSATDWPESGVNGAFAIKLASDDWTPVTTVWGSNDPETPRRHNQFIDVVAADPALSALICASDENNPAIVRLEYDPDALEVTWTGLYMPAISSWPVERPVNLSLEGLPGGPYASRLGAQTWSMPNNEESRILYSPDGVRWTQCYAPHERAQTPIAIADGRIWIGSTGGEHALRSIDVPSLLESSPIQLSGAGFNHMAPDMAPPSGVGAGVEVVKLDGAEALPADVPPPPCSDANIFRITGTQTSGTYGVWRPSGDDMVLPRPQKSVLVRFWIYAPGPDGDVFLEHASPSIWTRIRAIDGSGAKIDPKQTRTDRGAWMPITAWFTPDQFADVELADPWNLEVMISAVALTPEPAPADLIIAWDGVYIDRATIDGHGAPAQSPGATETGRVDGWTGSSESTLFAYGWVPFDAWDNRMGGGTTFNTHRHTLLRMIDTASNHNLRIVADPASLGVGLIGYDGQGSDAFVEDAAFWLRGSPVLLGVVTTGQRSTLHTSIGGGPIETVTLEGVSIPFDRVVIGESPMLWHSMQGVPYAMTDAEVAEHLTGLAPLESCLADVNADGELNILDFVAFQSAFGAGDPIADCDGDGDHDVIDFVCFQSLFQRGCS